jgi:hypothetical protein
VSAALPGAGHSAATIMSANARPNLIRILVSLRTKS